MQRRAYMANRLGKGLEAIFGNDIDTVIENIQQGKIATNGVEEIELSKIRPNPYQPRKVFNDEKIHELAASIKEHGMFQPILVRKSVQGYELLAGERRLRASKLAGLKTIKAIVMEFTEEQMMELSLLENIQRENLSVIEEAMAYQRLIERYGYTQEKLASKVGKSRAHITNILRLLKLPKSIQQLIQEDKLSMGHARALLPLEDEGRAYDIAMKVIEQGISVRDVELLVSKEKPKKHIKLEKKQDPKLRYVQDYMQSRLSTNVSVEPKQIVIKYQDVADLNRILELLGMIEE
ncbi:ParB/RepB/Spo0J family partition protein [Erysipelotrichaceae bacterium OH741_COT-311]|nr:ParB/RepB/Spo0J family partition protein [Erysipelotrichaceae bacterium]MDO5085170.1 ParB/RepB/Spo0J family partition protein [Erysipelotrichaceae bacterium]RRC91873.1 ParB/RepB/Spo0J family partition protein [Erysipelotrichaceae bacterium OH741_COT-311]